MLIKLKLKIYYTKTKAHTLQLWGSHVVRVKCRILQSSGEEKNCNINTQKNYQRWRKIIYCLQQQMNRTNLKKLSKISPFWKEGLTMTQTKRASTHDQDWLSVSCPMQGNFPGPHWLKLNHTVYYNWLNWEGEQMNSRGIKKMRKTETWALNNIVRKAELLTILKHIPSPTFHCMWFNSLDLNICCLGESVLTSGNIGVFRTQKPHY